HDPENWPLLREALRRMGRANLIGGGRQHLIPAFQPAGTARPIVKTARPAGRSGKRTPGQRSAKR
ncbi:MAG: DUF3362 domain-containing protein, partial [Rhodocyclaceae bacterium]|nr:DUF3362 domain-containing protein [Rhodocyclaceae bacterium]